MERTDCRVKGRERSKKYVTKKNASERTEKATREDAQRRALGNALRNRQGSE